MAKGSVYEGKTFEEAVRIGLDDLGLSRAEATITVIEEGKGGFLGFGARPFRVSIMRRPGGAVREPEEQRERRVSGGRRDDRRGGRGGRDRDRGGRDRDRDREGGGRRREEGEREKRREQPARAEGGRGEERRGERREGREGREPRESREPREPREVRAEGREESRREGRREGRREERREQPARAEGGRGEERREERRAERREERRPAAAEPPAVSAGADEAAGAEGGDASERRRRRRGRRGGRGRRREGVAGAPGEMVAGSVNGTESETEAFEPAESFAPHEAFEERRELETGDAPVEAVSAPAEVRAEAEPHPQAVAVAAAVETAEEPALASGELAETSRRLTEELLRAMGFEATVTVKTDGNRADVTAEIAKDEELLTGQKGEVRQALQHLLNRFVNRGEGSRYHLQLEINDFWQRRERELEDLARSLADQAASENAEVVTDYLNSQERRIVHVTLKEDEGVRTYSLGDGMIKRIAIAPAAFPDRTGEEDAG